MVCLDPIIQFDGVGSYPAYHITLDLRYLDRIDLNSFAARLSIELLKGIPASVRLGTASVVELAAPARYLNGPEPPSSLDQSPPPPPSSVIDVEVEEAPLAKMHTRSRTRYGRIVIEDSDDETYKPPSAQPPPPGGAK